MRMLVVTIVLALSGSAHAEPERSGFLVGLSLGGGGANACRDCLAGGGAAGELHLGWWINDRVAVGYEAWVVVGDANQLDTMSAQGLGLVTATIRVAPRWWVKGGAGLALYQEAHPLDDQLLMKDSEVELRGFGLGTAAGYELYQSRGSFVVEASGRIGASMFPDHGGGVSGALGVGVTWN
jgi:hypothetical protein